MILINRNNALKVALLPLLILLLSFTSINAQSQQPIKFKYAEFSKILVSLENEKFCVKKVRKKFDNVLKHSTIQNEMITLINDKVYYNDFVKEWSDFISNLNEKNKKKFLDFAEKHGLNDSPPF